MGRLWVVIQTQKGHKPAVWVFYSSSKINTKVQHKHCSSHVCLVRVFNILNVLGRGTTDLFGSYIVHCMYSTMYYMYYLRPYKGLQEEEDDRYGRPGMP